MLGHTHSLGGLMVGAATLPYAPIPAHGPPLQVAAMQTAWVAAWGGYAMLTDWDSISSTVSHMWGPLSAFVAKGVGFVARGHREGTHDAILAPITFACITSLIVYWQVGQVAALAVGIGLALRALAFAIPGRVEETVAGNFLISWLGAWWLVEHGYQSPRWLPIAVAGGILVHIAGDALTTCGVPVPFTWIDGQSRKVGLHLFETGARVEVWLIAPLFLAGTLWQLDRNTGAGVVIEPLVARLPWFVVAGLVAVVAWKMGHGRAKSKGKPEGRRRRRGRA